MTGLAQQKHQLNKKTMCGIAGIYAYSKETPPVNTDEMIRIRDHMAKRGPDGEGLWVSGNKRCGLAHRRLAIIDLTEAGHQPMATQDGRFTISFNGEIYNYQALRTELEQKGCVFQSHTDTEVLLHLYRLDGAAMLGKLRGMFAFAIWDEQQQNLFLARDHFGIKPLYYADNGNTFRFASQVKALLAGGQIDTTPEPAGLVGFYLWGSIPEPFTRYKGIRALPAGSYLTIDQTGRTQQHSYFDLNQALRPPETPITAFNQNDALEQLHSALVDSVNHHLIADVPVGLFLSAGLDSTTLVALATETKATSLRTVTLGFNEYKGTDHDETILAQHVANHYSTQHSTQWVQQQDFATEYQNLLAAMDQPSIDGVNTYFVCKAAKDAGLKVALSGLGGDELLGGYPSFKQIPKMVNALKPFGALPALGKGFRLLSAPLLKHYTSPKYAGLFEYGTDYAGAYLLRRGLYMPWELPQVLDPELIKQGWQDLNTLATLRHTVEGIKNNHLKVSALEIGHYMRNQLLRDTDWASMAHSLEVRTPLIDIDLFKAVTTLAHAGKPPSKIHMAISPNKQLPKAILDRPKTGFTIPVQQWLSAQNNTDTCPLNSLRTWSIAVANL
jgi:asparagine synthase (glutamine-hydrolysing)